MSPEDLFDKHNQEQVQELPSGVTQWGDVIRADPKTGAKRANVGKTRYDLVPGVAIRDTAEVFTFGSAKYGDWNWSKGFDWSVPYQSMQRHLQAWFEGEDFDPESGISHLAHAACNLMMLQHFEYFYKEGDNRPGQGMPPLRQAQLERGSEEHIEQMKKILIAQQGYPPKDCHYED